MNPVHHDPELAREIVYSQAYARLKRELGQGDIQYILQEQVCNSPEILRAILQYVRDRDPSRPNRAMMLICREADRYIDKLATAEGDKAWEHSTEARSKQL